MKTVLLLLLAFCFVSAPDIAQAQSVPPGELHTGYTREVLFSIPVGSKNQNIGVFWEPQDSSEGGAVHGLAVRHGRIYIGDASNQAVKVFDLRGRYLTRTEGNLSARHGKGINIPLHHQFPHQGILTSLRTLVVNQKNETFALSGLAYDVVSKFSPSGKLVWSMGDRAVLGARAKDKFGALLYPSPNGGVAVNVESYNDSSSTPAPGRLAWLDKQGKFIKIVDADWSDEKGFYTFTRTQKRPALTGTMRAFDGQGKLLFTRELSISSQAKSLFADIDKEAKAAGFGPELDRVASSPGGTFYSMSNVILHGRFDIRPNNNPTPYPNQSRSLYVVIIPYAGSGPSLKALRILSPPFSDLDTPITMDEHNNIYTVEYIPNKVRVVRYKFQGAIKQ